MDDKSASQQPNKNVEATSIKTLQKVTKNDTNVNVPHQTPSKNNKQTNDSIVKACLPFSDLLNGRIVHLSFDCPKNLRDAFKQATHSTGQTVCFVLRSFMQEYIVSQHYRKACFPNTLKPTIIENMIMPTYVKGRVRRVKVVDGFEDDPAVCHYCGSDAVGRFRYKKNGRVYALCQAHAKSNLDSKNWEVVFDDE